MLRAAALELWSAGKFTGSSATQEPGDSPADQVLPPSVLERRNHPALRQRHEVICRAGRG